MSITLQLRNAFRKWMGTHRLIEIRQDGKTFYMVQQAVFGFWWIDRFSAPFDDYDTAKKGLESCVAEYAPIDQKVISVKEVIPEKESRTWDTPSRPITPTDTDR